MNIKGYIQISLALLLGFLVHSGNAQNIPTACANTTVCYGIKALPNSTVVWDVTGGSIVSGKVWKDSVYIKWNNVSEMGTLSYTETNEWGCSGETYTTPVVVSKPTINLGTDKEICEGSILTVDAGNFVSYRWSDGSINQKFNISKKGTYFVEVKDVDGCYASDTFSVSTLPIPKVKLEDGISICAPETYLFENKADNNDIAYYEWSNGSSSMSYAASEGDTIVWLKVVNSIGCAGYDSTTIIPCDLGKKIPNAFTPGGGDQNEVWHLAQLKAAYPNLQIKIYDRWGRLVFTSDRGYNKPFDGTSNGKPLPMDTYYYVINLGNGAKDIVGSVAIIR